MRDGNFEIPPDEPEEVLIARLAQLPSLDYARALRFAARDLDVPIRALDHQVKKEWERALHEAARNQASIPETQYEVAKRFAESGKGKFIYDHTRGKWFVWRGDRWQIDLVDFVYGTIAQFCSECRAYARRGRDAELAHMGSAKFVSAVERFARALPEFRRTHEIWDADPWLLGVPGGYVDLRTGEMKPPDPEMYISKQTAVAPGRECPRWRQFLERITGGDDELLRYLQRVAGLSLTGITGDHVLFFFYGTGANGKGVFINTYRGVTGEYAENAPMTTFEASPVDQHPTELAQLCGARLVTAQETEEGRRWAESRIKSITGGDPITARFMRQDFFTYTPQFKLIIAGNHKPALRSVDEAIRRRFHLVPFSVTIPVAERDKELPEKLKEEWPGILAWAIEGCLEWQQIGLAPPPAVTGAIEEYLTIEDSLGTWLGERTREMESGCVETSALFADWVTWAKAAGEDPGSLKRFVQALKARGVKIERNGHTRRSVVPGLVFADVKRSHFETEAEWA